MAKLLFFADPKLRRKIRIVELVTSPVFNEFLELRQYDEGDGFDEALQNNWFSLQSTSRLHSLFQQLDTCGKGSLSSQQLLAYGQGNYTELFINRVFEEHVCKKRSPEGSSNQSEMNIEEFLTFLLAVKNRESPQSLSYFFQILDLEGQGYITGKEIHIFFREVHSKWIASETTELLQDDVTDEVFDMVGPARADRIYRRDLMSCSMGGTVTGMLTDYSEFWMYENREALVQYVDE
mmetsp:Transcript_1242/g.4393  ORF Transcript_1242/g.4393 Transcript_1242/m.4393 type:complete len:236 (+) Transcript_1242:127-834(+)